MFKEQAVLNVWRSESNVLLICSYS